MGRPPVPAGSAAVPAPSLHVTCTSRSSATALPPAHVSPTVHLVDFFFCSTPACCVACRTHDSGPATKTDSYDLAPATKDAGSDVEPRTPRGSVHGYDRCTCGPTPPPSAPQKLGHGPGGKAAIITTIKRSTAQRQQHQQVPPGSPESGRTSNASSASRPCTPAPVERDEEAGPAVLPPSPGSVAYDREAMAGHDEVTVCTLA